MAGVTRNADVKLKRSSRIGCGDGATAPFGIATVNVIPWYGASDAFENSAVDPLLVAVSHG